MHDIAIMEVIPIQAGDNIRVIKGIGDKTAKLLEKLGIRCVQDLLEHYPRAYEEFDYPVSIASLQEGMTASIEAAPVTEPKLRKVRNLQIINLMVGDSSGRLNLTWFNMPFLQRTLRMGSHYIFRGKVIRRNGILVIEQPKIYTKEQYYKLLKILLPVYPLTEGLSNAVLSKAIKEALSQFELAADFIPKSIAKANKLMDRTRAIKEIHFPKDRESLIKARQRLVFDEFFLYALALRKLKEKRSQLRSIYRMEDRPECSQLIEGLPYRLTKAQLRVWEEVKSDLKGEYIMNRLI